MSGAGPWVVLRFGLVGLVNTGVGLAVILALQSWLGWHPFGANAGGYLVGGLISYGLNRRFTFRSRRLHGQALPRFVVAMALCFGLNLLCLHLALGLLAWPKALAQAAAVLAYTVAFFVACRAWVFAPGAPGRTAAG